MLAPTPLLRPGPLDIPALFAGTFEALKRRLGLFMLLALLPSLVAIVLVGIAVAVLISAAISSGSDFRGLTIGLVIGMVILAAAVIGTVLAQLKAQGMTSLAAYEVAQGGNPDVRGLFRRTAGFLPRLAPVIAIFAVAAVAVYLLVFFLAMALVGALDGSSGGRAALVAGVLFVLVLLLIPAGIVLQVKLLYLVPAVAIEQRGGFDGIGRSWRLTRGAFWRTLGYYLVAGLAVAAIGYLVSLVGQLALAPVMFATDAQDPRAMLAALAMLAPAYLLVIALQVAVQLFTQPFLYAYTTYMFIDQVRRSETPAYVPGPYGGPQPGPYGDPQPGPYGGPQRY